MLFITIIVFLLTAIVGTILLVSVVSERHGPAPLPYIHGGLGITGIVLLLIYVLINPATTVIAALALFILAALGGLYMYFLDRNTPAVPRWFPFVHAAIALSAFATLLMHFLG
jgi:hypothetical protein